VLGISKAHGDNQDKVSGELQILLHKSATGQAALKTLGVLPLSNKLPILGALPLNNNNHLPILGALPLNNNNHLPILGALNNNHLLILGNLLPLNSSNNNLPTLGNLLPLLHLKILGDNSKQLPPNNKLGVCKQVYPHLFSKVSNNHLHLELVTHNPLDGHKHSKPLLGQIRGLHHQLRNQLIPADSRIGNKAVLEIQAQVL
jgi:hypothetical protein